MKIYSMTKCSQLYRPATVFYKRKIEFQNFKSGLSLFKGWSVDQVPALSKRTRGVAQGRRIYGLAQESRKKQGKMSSDARIYSASALDGCAMMVYAPSVLIILTALNALRLFRFSESWSDLFFHLSLFPWQPSGLGQRRLTGCLLKSHSIDSRDASNMTNASYVETVYSVP